MPDFHLPKHADRLCAFVDAAAVAHNLSQLRRRLNHRATRIWATAKADAYGHGLNNVMPGLQAADGVTVQTLSEAHACHQAGWKGPILVHTGLLRASDIQALTLPNLHLIISHEDQLRWLADGALPMPPAIWLRYAGDTRMGGFDDQAYAQAHRQARALQDSGRTTGTGHLNHYAQAEAPQGITEALRRFQHVVAGLPGPISTCNSAALLQQPDHAAQTDWIRPGIALYGVSPLADITGQDLGLRAAMTLIARLGAIHRLPAGASLGYSGAFVAERDMRIGLVSCGYADGYPRHAGTGTPVLAAGRLTRLLGRPSMDALAIDLTDAGDIALDAPITLWGAELPVERVAASATTIAAELLTGLTARVPFAPLC
ncbi:alanine racemase [Castellaniella sp.]|uniref:alanine racemase n=1 Tax=Castellaniella sp. TaxID=1955812 RepID=UPI002AFFC159|nr:alanine racemase [Castellaniella sp.]